MNLWQTLLKAIKLNGYAGQDNDLAAVKSFVNEHNGGEVTLSGKAVDLDGEYAKAYPPKAKLDLTAASKDAEIDRLKAELETKSLENDITGVTKGARTANAQTVNDVTVGKDRAADDKSWGFKSFGHLASELVARGNGDHLTKAMENASVIAKAQGVNQTIGSEGGFLVPPQFASMVWDGMNKGTQNLLDKTDNYMIDGESMTFTANAETDRATGSRYGGVRGYWIPEAGEITKSTPKLRQVKVAPKELAVLCYATDKLIRNASGLNQWLTRAAGDEINFMIGDAIINGTGAGQPVGIVGNLATVQVAKETGQAAATILPENIANMHSRLHANFAAGAEWLINQQILPQLHLMTLPVGTGGMPVYMPPGGLSGAPYGTLYGLPVRPIEYCAALGTVGDIILWNGKGYLSGTASSGVDAAVSMHLRFQYAETAFRFMFAVDGQPWMANKLTPYKGTSNTLSAFVTLATRA